MITRLLTLALAATGLSVGGFQLGARQTSDLPTTNVSVPADLPAGHALTVALQEPNSRVSMTDKERLRYLVLEMESAKKAEADARVRILREKIADLERQIKVKQLNKDLYEVRTGDNVVRIRTPKAKAKAPAKAKNGKTSTKSSQVVRYYAFGNGNYRVQLETAERERARQLVERRYEDIAIQSLPSQVRTRVQAEARGLRAEDGERGFALLIALRERAALGLTPQQVTKLQLLQADFLRRFAPLREESETEVMWSYPDPAKEDGEVALTLAPTKGDKGKAKEERIQVFEANQVTIEYPKPVTWVYEADPKNKPPKGDQEATYVFEAVPTKGNSGDVKAGTGKTAKVNGAKKQQAVTFRIFVAQPGDVDKRIEALKAEIDDKVYEVLNDDQGKRLRRMVALSLSPQP